MQGMSFDTLKKHPALLPLYVVAAIGGLGAAFYSVRLATRSPDVTWSHSQNPEPNNAYREKQYKFYNAAGRTWEDGKSNSQAPNYKDDK